jgi:hypothetical protein
MTDLTPNDLSHLSDEEFNALCPQGFHATGDFEPDNLTPEEHNALVLISDHAIAPPLSPAAQAVKDAVLALYSDENVQKFGWQLDAPSAAHWSNSMTDLSPAAQAILDAAFTPYDCDALYSLTEEQHTGIIAAAALRALADQVVPEEPLYGGDQRWEWERDARQSSRKKILAIATELEAHG